LFSPVPPRKFSEGTLNYLEIILFHVIPDMYRVSQNYVNIKVKEKNITIYIIIMISGACGSVVVKALRYFPEGRGFETR
jgi:hypothetical protein